MLIIEKIYRKIRYKFNDLLFNLSLGQPLLENRLGKRIIVFHGVDSVGSLAYNTRFISERLFEQQILCFKENFHIVSLKDYYENRISVSKLTIALTFDDGYANNFTRILPILEKYQVPATFFITAIRAKNYAYLWTDFYDMLRQKVKTLSFDDELYIQNRHKNFVSKKTGHPLNEKLRKLSFSKIENFINEVSGKTGLKMNDFPADYHLQMTCEQIKLMAQSSYATIGSHTSTHADITKLPIEVVSEELKFSKEWLEKVTNKKIDAFAFPYGVYNLETIKVAKSLGYQYLLAGALNERSDEQIPELQGRFGNNPFLSLKNQIWCLLNEKYL